MDEPLVSVIIPVYNAEATIRQALDSWCRQTLSRIEIICVDDCSTDRSAEILKNFAQQDARVKLLRHDVNRFAGVARNTGMTAAGGRYLFFADADDWADKKLLEKAVRQAERDQADVVLLPADKRDGATGRRLGILPLAPAAAFLPEPFNFENCPTEIFCLVSSNPWNKLFRREFISKNRLEFQDLRNTNDLAFSLLSLACARKIGCLRHFAGYHYNSERPGSLQHAKKDAPLAVLLALSATRKGLEERGLWETLRPALEKFILTAAIGYDLLENPPSGEHFQLYYEELRDRFLPAFQLTDPAKANTQQQKMILQMLLRYPDGRDFLLAVTREQRQELHRSRVIRSIRFIREYGWCKYLELLLRKLALGILP